jgi:hypothetical protein
MGEEIGTPLADPGFRHSWRQSRHGFRLHAGLPGKERGWIPEKTPILLWITDPRRGPLPGAEDGEEGPD